MTEKLAQGDRILRPQPQSKPNFEAQLGSLLSDVRSVASSLALREPESARRLSRSTLQAGGRAGLIEEGVIALFCFYLSTVRQIELSICEGKYSKRLPQGFLTEY